MQHHQTESIRANKFAPAQQPGFSAGPDLSGQLCAQPHKAQDSCANKFAPTTRNLIVESDSGPAQPALFPSNARVYPQAGRGRSKADAASVEASFAPVADALRSASTNLPQPRQNQIKSNPACVPLLCGFRQARCPRHKPAPGRLPVWLRSMQRRRRGRFLRRRVLRGCRSG